MKGTERVFAEPLPEAIFRRNDIETKKEEVRKNYAAHLDEILPRQFPDERIHGLVRRNAEKYYLYRFRLIGALGGQSSLFSLKSFYDEARSQTGTRMGERMEAAAAEAVEHAIEKALPSHGWRIRPNGRRIL